MRRGYICIYSENMCYDAIYNKESSMPNVLATLPRRKATWLAAATHSLSLSLYLPLSTTASSQIAGASSIQRSFIQTRVRALNTHTHTRC